MLNEAQNAIAGWRRVLGVLDTPPDVADPGAGRRRTLPRGPIDVRFEDVAFAYPGGAAGAARRRPWTIAPRSRVAVVGETGSGKTTFAKLLTRLMDPARGRVLVDGVDLREIRFSSLRERIVMVPQDGFLFDGTPRRQHPVRPAGRRPTRRSRWRSPSSAWPTGWRACPPGSTPRWASAASRCRRASASSSRWPAPTSPTPTCSLLDEATSAVDPATEVRLARALEGVTRGRTAVSIAHRLSTAEAADEVLVFDRGRIVQRGPHAELVAQPGVYADLYASWTSGTRS